MRPSRRVRHVDEGIGVVLYGLGAIGRELGKFVAEKKGLRIAGAIDIDPNMEGRDVGEILGVRRLGIQVGGDPDRVLKEAGGDVVLHCTTSQIWQAHEQLAKAAVNGYDVISTCEELAYPWRQHRHIALEIDQFAKREGVTILGTGVNPGFAHDAFVLALTSMCKRVDRIEALRVVDATKRRLPLQRKIGATMTPEAFRAAAKEGRLGHVGTYESIEMVAETIGWNLEEVQVTLDPVVATRTVRSDFLGVEPGQVAGLRQVGRGYAQGREVITLDLQMYLGAEDPRDAVRIHGLPDLDVEVHGGFLGDHATVAAVVNSIPHVMEAEPGLKTIRDLRLPSYFDELVVSGRH